jgi:hypothetical protein
MALEETVKSLPARLDQLEDALTALRVTFLEDRPPKGADVALFDYFELGAEDVLGWVVEARAAARTAVRSFETDPPDLYLLRRSLWQCHQRAHRVSRHFHFELAPFDRVCELVELGRSRKGEWLGWAESVRDTLGGCRGPLQELNESLSICWWELSDRIGMNSVSVSSTNIGQQIAVAKEEDVWTREPT